MPRAAALRAGTRVHLHFPLAPCEIGKKAREICRPKMKVFGSRISQRVQRLTDARSQRRAYAAAPLSSHQTFRSERELLATQRAPEHPSICGQRAENGDPLSSHPHALPTGEMRRGLTICALAHPRAAYRFFAIFATSRDRNLSPSFGS